MDHETFDRNESETDKVNRELAQLHKQAAQARAVLARLQRDVADAEGRLGSTESARLIEANGQLVLALLRANSDAATAASERRLELPALESLREASTHHESALAEHVRGHAQLQSANEQLVLAALDAQDLQAAAERAQRRQTEFLAVLAHELRNPLAPIRTAAALLGRVNADEPLLARVQGVIERQVVHISRMVDDLLDVSRVNTGKLRLESRKVEMAGIISEAVEACRPVMAARGQVFNLQLPPWSPEVHGDPVRLAQILSNLLDNASKYTKDGGTIWFSTAVSHDTLAITISDDGIGITAEALPKVFDPFVQDLHATVFNGVGLGIGLTVVRELVEAHGGRIVASSAGSGLGSQFVVTLPLAR